MATYYKVLNKDRTACHGGTGSWFAPHGKRSGKWMPKVPGTITCCHMGYHLGTADQLIEWLGPTIWVAEGRGDTDVESDKTAFRQARLVSRVKAWNERTARLFACDCAERVLHIFEEKYPDDKRPRQAIEVARRFAEGKATREELTDARAAGDAARAAAGAAAWTAAGIAAWDAARATRAATWAAGAAARDAVGTAARAAWDAVGTAAERKWQTSHLCEMLGIDDGHIN